MSRQMIDRSVQGQRIKFARRAKGLTQEELAELVSQRVVTPISNNIISEIEKGNRPVLNEEMLAFVELLEQSQMWLEGRGGEFSLPKGVYQGSLFSEVA